MEKFLFARAFLNLASKGSFFRKIIAVALRVGAILIAIGGIVAFVQILNVVMKMPSSTILGGLIFELFLLVALYVVVHISWIRAGDIERLPESKFNVIPIVALLIKITGEIYSCAGAILAIGAGIFIWFAGQGTGFFLQQFLPISPFMTSSSQAFTAGLLVMVYGVIICFSILIFSYFTSELILLGAQIERNTYSILQVADQYAVVRRTDSTRPGAVESLPPQGRQSTPRYDPRLQVPPPPAPPPALTRCPRCGLPSEPGSRFCESCGTSLS